MTDLALNHGLPQSSLGGIFGGLDPLDLQESPEAVCVQGVARAPQDCMPDSSSLSDQAALPCIAEFMDPAAVMASPHRDDGQSRLAP